MSLWILVILSNAMAVSMAICITALEVADLKRSGCRTLEDWPVLGIANTAMLVGVANFFWVHGFGCEAYASILLFADIALVLGWVSLVRPINFIANVSEVIND